MYRALYRKWRPQTFADVVGQEAITTALSNQILADKVGHAYLFTGTRGTGKTSCAKILAKAVNCENPNGAEPCGECPMCLGLENGSILDVAEIDAASNNGVDDVRDLRDETAYRPSRGRYRVYIIDEVHMLSTAAFNALLKILEEPPSHVIFILATTEIHKVPATILSRCQRFDFGRITAESIAKRLDYVAQQEGIELSADAADLIARLADGSMRDALSLLDTCAGGDGAVDEALVRKMAGVTDKTYLFSISDAVQAGDAPKVLQLLAALHSQSIDMRRLCEELIFHYRSFLLVLAEPGGSLLENVPRDQRKPYVDRAGSLGERFVISAIRRLSAAMDKMGRSPAPRVELELALFDMCELAQGGPLDSATRAIAPASVVPTAKASAHPATPPEVAQPKPPAAVATGTAPSPIATPPLSELPFDLDDTAPPLPKAGDKTKAVPGPDATAPKAAMDEASPFTATRAASAGAEEERQAAATPAPDEIPFDVDDVATAPKAAVPQADLVPPAAPAGQESAISSAAPVLPDETQTALKQSLTDTATQREAADGPQLFAPWQDVLAKMAGVDRLLSSYMDGSTAYTDGTRVLIDGGNMFLSFMRENEFARERIKTVIQEVTGRRYGIGPYEAPEKQTKKNTAQDTLKEWEQMGVPIRYE